MALMFVSYLTIEWGHQSIVFSCPVLFKRQGKIGHECEALIYQNGQRVAASAIVYI